MPTIQQLPVAEGISATDELPVSQGGVTRSVSIAELLSGTQIAITIPSPSVLGRASLGPGAPEPLALGNGVALQNAAIVANGSDHLSFQQQLALTTTDEVVLNSSGTPKRMTIPLLRGIYSAGGNIGIDANGVITAATDPSVTTQLQSLGQGISTTESQVVAIAARLPPGNLVGLNAQGQITAPTAGAVSLGTVSVANGAPSRTMVSRANDTLNVVDFGAVAGGADCSSAFNAAFAALPANGGEMFIPAGDFWIAAPLLFANKPVVVRGAGRGISKLHFSHNGIGIDFSSSNVFNKASFRDFSAYAESSSGQTAAAIRITYPALSGFGYVSAVISDIECFGYPNAANGTAPFPQTFLRGVVLNNCWSTQVNNISWFGPPAPAGATSSAVIEVNRSFDTRIHGLQAYYGDAVVLQTGYCEGIYLTSPLVVGVDYVFRQTDETQWPGYSPNKPMLLGFWAANGELHVNLGIVQMSNVTDVFFVGLDITRDGGPNTSQTLFNLANVSNLHVTGCNFVGGPSGGSSQDVAFGFTSTWNSSSNIIDGCHFEDMATVIKISGPNGTVGLTTYGLHLGNVPVATAVIDSTSPQTGNHLSFMTPATSSIPAGIGLTTDHVFTGGTGSVLFRISNVANAANFIRHQPATASNPPTICFDGSDGQVNGTIQTKGGNFYINAAGGTTGSGNLLSLLNAPNASNWPVLQNATTGNLSLLTTNTGGLGLQPKGSLWLSPATGLFAPGLPTVKPASGTNQIWNNNGVLSIA